MSIIHLRAYCWSCFAQCSPVRDVEFRGKVFRFPSGKQLLQHFSCNYIVFFGTQPVGCKFAQSYQEVFRFNGKRHNEIKMEMNARIFNEEEQNEELKRQLKTAIKELEAAEREGRKEV